MALAGASWVWDRDKAIAEAQAWTITGPPCPAVSRQQALASALPANQAVDYDDVRFIRRFGHMSCNEITYDGGRGFGTFPVCQFTSPATLEIVTPRGAVYFAPGVGHPATVSVPHGKPVCVLNSHFTAREDPT